MGEDSCQLVSAFSTMENFFLYVQKRMKAFFNEISQSIVSTKSTTGNKYSMFSPKKQSMKYPTCSILFLVLFSKLIKQNPDCSNQSMFECVDRNIVHQMRTIHSNFSDLIPMCNFYPGNLPIKDNSIKIKGESRKLVKGMMTPPLLTI